VSQSAAMKAWLGEPTQRCWLVTEMRPGYVHDLNPIEMVWGNVRRIGVVAPFGCRIGRSVRFGGMLALRGGGNDLRARHNEARHP
jgi:hypothetical protein